MWSPSGYPTTSTIEEAYSLSCHITSDSSRILTKSNDHIFIAWQTANVENVMQVRDFNYAINKLANYIPLPNLPVPSFHCWQSPFTLGSQRAMDIRPRSLCRRVIRLCWHWSNNYNYPSPVADVCIITLIIIYICLPFYLYWCYSQDW